MSRPSIRFGLGAVVIVGLAMLAYRPAAAAAPAADARPNILLCIADDWSWPHAGVYGDTVVKTPTFDRVAAEGMLFTRAFCAAPSCSPSRAAVLTGQAPHRLAEGANLWGSLPARFPVYPDVLEKAGYHVGFTGKGWGPGQLGDRTRNPAGKPYKSFEQFLKSVPAGKPFCFWFGSHDPHRPYKLGQGAEAGLKAVEVKVPAFLPDTPEVRGDILDYYFAAQRFDRDSGEILKQLEAAGTLDQTLVVMTGDNGLPFPRAKTNLYDSGSRMPLAVRWPGHVKPGRTTDALVSLTDLGPTFVEAAGLTPGADMTGRSLLPILTDTASAGATTRSAAREAVFIERERHANVREGDLGYPARAIRTDKFLYVRNFRPDLWPAGDPKVWVAVGPFGDIDPGPSKAVVTGRRADEKIAPFFALACAKRPAEELYDLSKDPDQLRNVAGQADYAGEQARLRAALDGWMRETADPRADGGGAYEAFDKYPYYGTPAANDRLTAPATGPTTRPAP